MADPEQVRKDLGHLATLLTADVWGALGGEPTLHPKLVEILGIVRASGIAPRLEVWTNGIALPKMKDDFWQSFDVLVHSIYPGKQTEEELAWIQRRCQEVGVEYSPRDERNNHNFKTLLEPWRTNEADTKAKFAGCFFRHFSRNASYGYLFTCCCAPHLPALVQGREFGEDGVKIEGLTEAGLAAYLGREEPLGACYDCAGRDTAQNIEWSEEKNPKMWVLKSAGLPASIN